MAEKNGTTLANAFRDYAEVEDWYRTDPLDAVMRTWARLGYDPNAMVVKLAERHAHIPAKAYEAGFAEGHAKGKAAGIIEQFAATHPDFEKFRPRMAAIASAEPSLPIDGVYSQAKWSPERKRS